MKNPHYTEIQAEIDGQRTSVKKIEFETQIKRNVFMDKMDEVSFIKIVGFGNGVWGDD
jgi:hypothetical protein